MELPPDIRYDRAKARYSIPEVVRLQPEQGKVKLTEARQWLIYDLNRRLNPHISTVDAKRAFRSLLQWNRAYTNGSGFNDESDPRADYINGIDLDCELPELHQLLVCGGASMVATHRSGDRIYLETIDGSRNGATPSVDYVLKNPHLYHFCVSIPGWEDYEKPRPLDPIEPFPQFWPYTAMPNFSNGEVYIHEYRTMEFDTIHNHLTVHRRL